jgi:hypothetical protein
MTSNALKPYQVTVIERVLAFYEVEAIDARTAAENWQDGEFSDRDDEALESEGPSSVREQQPDCTWLTVPRAQWQPVSEIARFDDYEIHGMKRLPSCYGQEEEPVGFVINNCEQVPDDEAEFWSLLGHIPGQGLDCIGDFETRQHAEEIHARITGRRYA